METVYLVISDDGIRDALRIFLESFDVPVQAFSDAADFLDSAGEVSAGCVLVEAELAGLNGLGLLRQLRTNGNQISVLLLVNTAIPEFTQRAIQVGASAVLEKPLANDEVVTHLRRFIGVEYRGLAEAHSQEEVLADGTQIVIRAMQPGDRDIERDFVRNLSPQSRYRRFFAALRELSEPMLEDFTHIHFPNKVAFIATVCVHGAEQEVGVARYATTAEQTAEFAVVIADAWQNRGVATLLLRRLIGCVANANIECIEGTVMSENRGMLKLARELGFQSQIDAEDGSLIRLSRKSNDPLSGFD